MKKKLLVASLVLIGGLGVCSIASAALNGSKHDFTTMSGSGGQICLPCHAPHNNKNAAGELLWNHNPTVATFILYGSPSMQGVPGQPSPVSKFCLSCHDGTLAPDAYGTHIPVSTPLSGNALIGTNLSNDHPVSFLYDGALATADGGGLKTPVSASLVVTGIPLFAGKMECATCHDVHNKHATALGTGLLNSTNAASALCLKCHNK